MKKIYAAAVAVAVLAPPVIVLQAVQIKNEIEMALDTLTNTLYATYHARLYRYLHFRVRNKNDAEDLLQTVFLKAFKSLKSGLWDGEGGTCYLFSITRNTLIDHYRRQKNMPIASDDLVDMQADFITTDAPVEERENREWLKNAVDKLCVAEASAINLRFFSDMEYATIAKEMDRREDAVRQLVHRGLKSLRKILVAD